MTKMQRSFKFKIQIIAINKYISYAEQFFKWNLWTLFYIWHYLTVQSIKYLHILMKRNTYQCVQLLSKKMQFIALYYMISQIMLSNIFQVCLSVTFRKLICDQSLCVKNVVFMRMRWLRWAFIFKEDNRGNE